VTPDICIRLAGFEIIVEQMALRAKDGAKIKADVQGSIRESK
jgi:hypothetical protein